MNIYEVKGITANLASVGSTCHYMRTALIFTKDSVYIAPEEILIPDQVKVGTYNVEKGLYEVDDNFLEHNILLQRHDYLYLIDIIVYLVYNGRTKWTSGSRPSINSSFPKQQ